MQLIFQNDHVVINLVGVLFGGCYRRSYFELCVCARGQWKVRIRLIGEHEYFGGWSCNINIFSPCIMTQQKWESVTFVDLTKMICKHLIKI